MWTERDLQTMLDPQLFYQGRLIEMTGGVYSFETYKSTSEYGDLQLDIVAEVRDKNEHSYSVEVTMYYDDDMEEDRFDYYCPCDYFREEKDLCKHCVATLLHYIHKPKKSLLTIDDDFTPDEPKHTFSRIPLLNSLRTIPVPVLQIMEWHSFYVGWESRKTGFLPPVPSQAKFIWKQFYIQTQDIHVFP